MTDTIREIEAALLRWTETWGPEGATGIPPEDEAQARVWLSYLLDRVQEMEEVTSGVNGYGCVKPDNDKQVFFYEQDFYVLSNFSAFNLMWNGHTYPTSEHAYQAMKFSHPLGGEIAKEIANAPSAHAAFKLAEKHSADRRHDWDQIKVDVMRQILRAKAEQHEYVRRKLLATGDRELVEDSWRDDFWGWGPNREGKNMLGLLWMEVRYLLSRHGGGEG